MRMIARRAIVTFRWMAMRYVVRLVPSRLAPEGQEHQPPRVKAGQQRAEHRNEECDATVLTAARKGCFDDRILRIETGKPEHAEDADTRYCQGARQHRVEGIRDMFPKAAIIAHVLFMVHRMDHRPGAKEQQRLKERVGEQVEHRPAKRTDACGHEHIAELRAG